MHALFHSCLLAMLLLAGTSLSLANQTSLWLVNHSGRTVTYAGQNIEQRQQHCIASISELSWMFSLEFEFGTDRINLNDIRAGLGDRVFQHIKEIATRQLAPADIFIILESEDKSQIVNDKDPAPPESKCLDPQVQPEIPSVPIVIPESPVVTQSQTSQARGVRTKKRKKTARLDHKAPASNRPKPSNWCSNSSQINDACKVLQQLISNHQSDQAVACMLNYIKSRLQKGARTWYGITAFKTSMQTMLLTLEKRGYIQPIQAAGEMKLKVTLHEKTQVHSRTATAEVQIRSALTQQIESIHNKYIKRYNLEAMKDELVPDFKQAFEIIEGKTLVTVK